MNDSDNFWKNAADMVRALHGCSRTERVVQVYSDSGALGQDPRTQHQAVAPPSNTISKPGVTSFPSRLVQGAIATGAALGVTIGAALNVNIFVTSFAAGVGAGLGSVATAVNKKDPKKEAQKLLLAAGDRYARNGDLDKLTMVKEILGEIK